MFIRIWLMVFAALLTTACNDSKSPPDDDRDTHANAVDCAPNDSRAWQQIAFNARDTDGDGFGVNSAGQVCAGAILPAGYFADAVLPANADCDDSDRSRWATRPFSARDVDNDAHLANSTGSLCSGATLPEGYFADAVEEGAADCNDSDAATWLAVSYGGRDHDADSFPIDETGSLCQADSTLPARYFAAVSREIRDCNDADATMWRIVSVYRDEDGDGVGAGARTSPCIGRNAPIGFSLKGYDPNDSAADPAAILVSDFDLPPLTREPPQEADDEDIF